jgi:mannose-1-phosphate guanylyltransferase
LPAPDPHLWTVVLAGGIGSRFWPASTPSRPKQLLSLASDRPLIADTVRRGVSLVPEDRLRILTGRHLVPPFQAALPELPDGCYWTEPRARGTGPVLAWAAHRIHREDPEAVMVSLHADHLIQPEDAFLELLPRAAALARGRDLLLTVAVRPDRPETGYGYIRPGDPISGEEGLRAWRVGAFVEKPDRSTAESYVRSGYLWNSGIFIWPVNRFLDEVRTHAPEIGGHLSLLDRDEDEAFFEGVSTISVDEAVLERSGRVGTVEATFAWDDVGSWQALARTLPGDPEGNHLRGPAHAVESRGNVGWAEDGPVVLFGVDDLVVVRASGITLVTHRSRSGDLKGLLARLPAELRESRGAKP